MSIEQLYKIPAIKYTNGHVVAHVKPEPNCDFYWFACGDDWSNISRGLVFKLSYSELINEGWRKL